MDRYRITDSHSQMLGNKERAMQDLEFISIRLGLRILQFTEEIVAKPWRALNDVLAHHCHKESNNDRGDVPGWVLVVLMTAGLVTGIWTIAAPRLNLILKNSLDSMNAIR